MNLTTCTMLVGLLCGLLSVSATASTAYFCVTDMATGFALDKSRKEWRPTQFDTKRKYLVSKVAEAPIKIWEGNDVWEVKTVGSSPADAVCADDCNAVGSLVCEGFIEFRMKNRMLWFLLTHPVGYWTDTLEASSGEVLFPEGKNTPFLAIGKCSPLSGTVSTSQDVPPQAGPPSSPSGWLGLPTYRRIDVHTS